jgi:hypothetical protein
MTPRERLYNLLPLVYRDRDASAGYVLRALLDVIDEQAKVLERDLDRLYDNWFIETCEDWVVPYIGELIGYRSVLSATGADPSGALGKILAPRREVATTIHHRRRKGTLALLESLGQDVAGWPARAIESYPLLAVAPHLDLTSLSRGRTVDLRAGTTLDLIGSPFDRFAHTVDVRRPGSERTVGRFNIPGVTLFAWRLRSFSVSWTSAEASGWQTPAGWTAAYCAENAAPNCYTFSVLGNSAPLYNRPGPEREPTHMAGELNVPAPIRRRAFDDGAGRASTAYYGAGKSLLVWAPGWPRKDAPQPIPAASVIPADLRRWNYDPPRDHVAIDPVTGRIAFPSVQLPRQGVRVFYHYGFAAEIGGGEYRRQLSQPAGAKIYPVGEAATFRTIRAAVDAWAGDPAHPSAAVIEIGDSGVYSDPLTIVIPPHESLQIRAASGMRPIIRLLDYTADLPDGLGIQGGKGSRIVLDGLLIMGRGLQIVGPDREDPNAGQDLCRIVIRHCTLVPGWGLHDNCEPKRPAEASLSLLNTTAQVVIEHSILGAIEVAGDDECRQPIEVSVRDSIWDATGEAREALSGADCDDPAYTALTVVRSTVIGRVLTHELMLAENSIFMSVVHADRRQRGCMRFCYVPPPSRTPQRYACQPDGVIAGLSGEAQAYAAARVRPRFNSSRYGTPTYAQLAAACAVEIATGADDRSEMGAFHHLYVPQRRTSLRARLEEFTPAGADAGVIFVT